MELPDHSMTVPEGITIAPAHFLTGPDDSHRDAIEGDGHTHYIVKVYFKNGNLHMEKIDSFTKVEGKFSFSTTELQNHSLCFLTTATLFGLIPGKPYCEHGSVKSFLVSRKTKRCPHIDGAFVLNLLCDEIVTDKTKLQTHLESTGEKEEYVPEHIWKINISPGQNYQIKTEFGDASRTICFSFMSLCRDNGKQVLGDICSNLKTINCRAPQTQKIAFDTYQEEKSIPFHRKVLYIDSCEHEYDCTEAGASRLSKDEMKGKESSPTLAQNFYGERHTASGGNFILGDTTYNIHQMTEDKKEDLSPNVTYMEILLMIIVSIAVLILSYLYQYLFILEL